MALFFQNLVALLKLYGGAGLLGVQGTLGAWHWQADICFHLVGDGVSCYDYDYDYDHDYDYDCYDDYDCAYDYDNDIDYDYD